MARRTAEMELAREALRAQVSIARWRAAHGIGASFLQSLAGNRPMQVALAIGFLQLAGRDGKFSDQVGDILGAAGMAAYLANSDGGISLGYDVPDVGGGGVAGNATGASGFLPFP